MSRSFKKYVWGAVILAIAFVFIVQFNPAAQQREMGVGAGEDTCAVESDGRCIVSQSDYHTALRLVGAGADDDNRRQLAQTLVLEGLIQRWLLLEDAERLGLSVSEEEVSRTLARGLVRVSLPADQEVGMLTYQLGLQQPDGPARAIAVKDPKTERFDSKRYEKWVRTISGKTLKGFREFARNEELAARVRRLVQSRVRISEEEAYSEYALTNSKIVVDHVQLNSDWYRRRVDASDEFVAKWAEQESNKKAVDEVFAGKKDEFTPVCRKARHLFVRVDDSGDRKEATKKAEEKIAAAKQRLDKGESFADVARALSEDAKTAADGGLLGCFASGKLAAPNTDKAVDDAVFAAEKGKVGPVVASAFGLHLVTVDAVFEKDAAEKEGRLQVARGLYVPAEAERLALEGAKQILAAVKAGKTLQVALDAHLAPATEAAKDARTASAADGADRPQIATSKPFTMAEPPFPGASNAFDASSALFDLEVGGATVEPIKTFSGYAVAQVKEKQALDPKDWEANRGKFLDALREEKERDALIRYVHGLRDKHSKSITYKVKVKDDSKPKASKDDAPKPDDSALPAPPPVE